MILLADSSCTKIFFGSIGIFPKKMCLLRYQLPHSIIEASDIVSAWLNQLLREFLTLTEALRRAFPSNDECLSSKSFALHTQDLLA